MNPVIYTGLITIFSGIFFVGFSDFFIHTRFRLGILMYLSGYALVLVGLIILVSEMLFRGFL